MKVYAKMAWIHTYIELTGGCAKQQHFIYGGIVVAKKELFWAPLFKNNWNKSEVKWLFEGGGGGKSPSTPEQY